MGVLSESDNQRKYWSVLKTRLKAEGSQLATNSSQLKMKAEDGKMRLTDFALFRPRRLGFEEVIRFATVVKQPINSFP